jgi:hypothetical protein
MENPFFIAIVGDMSMGASGRGYSDAFEEQGYPVQRIDITPFEGSNWQYPLEVKDLVHNSIDLLFIIQSAVIYDLSEITIPWIYLVNDITHICWPKYPKENPAKQFYYTFYGAPDIYKNNFAAEMGECHHEFLPFAINPKEWKRDLLYTKWFNRKFQCSFVGNHIHDISTNPFLTTEPRQSNWSYIAKNAKLYIFDLKYPSPLSQSKRDELLISAWEENTEPTPKDVSFMLYQWSIYNSKFILSIPWDHNFYDQLSLDALAAGCVLLQYSTITNREFPILNQLGLIYNNNCYLFNEISKLDLPVQNKSEIRQSGIELVYSQHTYTERFNQIITIFQHIVENREETQSCALL